VVIAVDLLSPASYGATVAAALVTTPSGQRHDMRQIDPGSRHDHGLWHDHSVSHFVALSSGVGWGRGLRTSCCRRVLAIRSASAVVGVRCCPVFAMRAV